MTDTQERVQHTPDDTQVIAQLLTALEVIKARTAPGQMLGISEAIDLICDVWTEARTAIAKAEGRS
jgi:hypothetical protein